MAGKLAAAIASFALWVLFRTHSMFDWPEQIQTSPTSTFLIEIFLSPAEILISVGSAFAGSGARVAAHRPSGPALEVIFWPAKETSTSWPGSAQPQIFTGISRWRTMLSEKNRGRLRARAGVLESQAKPAIATRHRAERRFFMGARVMESGDSYQSRFLKLVNDGKALALPGIPSSAPTRRSNERTSWPVSITPRRSPRKR